MITNLTILKEEESNLKTFEQIETAFILRAFIGGFVFYNFNKTLKKHGLPTTQDLPEEQSSYTNSNIKLVIPNFPPEVPTSYWRDKKFSLNSKQLEEVWKNDFLPATDTTEIPISPDTRLDDFTTKTTTDLLLGNVISKMDSEQLSDI